MDLALLKVPAAPALPGGLTAAMTWFQTSLHGWNGLFPVIELLLALAVVVAVEVGIFTFRATLKVYHMIRG